MISDNKGRDVFWKVAAILLLIIVNVINLKNPILEQHSFRQTQTAISIFYLIKDGWTLDYITPVIGQAYTIPFEFPIFHFIVGLICKYSNISLDILGRLTSLMFAIGALIANDLLLREISIDKRVRLFCFLLIVCTPVFLFWSGTFMIESAALFFTITSLLLAAKYVRIPRNLYLYLWFFFVSFALLQKVTTALLPYFLSCFVILYTQFKLINKKCSPILWMAKLLAVLVLLALPIVIAYGWVIYTDILKSSNPIALFKLTSSALSAWNYGTYAQRFISSFWISNLYIRAVAPSMLLGFGVIAIVLCFLDRLITQQLKIILAVFIGLYFIPQITFTNLFIVHNYYHYAVIIYLCNAVGIAYTYANFGYNLKRSPYYFLVATCICSLIFFMREYRHAKFSRIDDSFPTLAIAREIKNQTSPEDVFVLFGYDWSSEVAYYAQRKSLTVPEWYLDKLKINHLEEYIDKTPKLIIFCNNQAREYDQLQAEMIGYIPENVLQGCIFFKQRKL
jgi:hypothetical protein